MPEFVQYHYFTHEKWRKMAHSHIYCVVSLDTMTVSVQIITEHSENSGQWSEQV